MKKIKILLVFFISVFIPCTVNAYELKCDAGQHNYQEYFYCRIKGEKNKNYVKVTGDLSSNENISCKISSIGAGLSNNSTDGESFILSGITQSDIIATYRCQVIKKIENEDYKTQLLIENFEYLESGKSSSLKEILRSEYISLPKYTVTTTTGTTKPRNTSNGNSLLQYLQAENLDINFSRFITEYNIEVLYEVNKINLKYSPVNPQAIVRVDGNTNLRVGENLIDIYVTSPDKKTTTCYTLNIKRLARGENIYYPESDSTLASLTIPGYAINFEKEIKEYAIHIGSDIDEVEVTAIPTFENAIVDVSGNTNLQHGSIISINVISYDGNSETRYKVNVTKDAPKVDYTPYIILGGLVIAIIIIIILIIKSSQKRKKDPLLSIKSDKRKVNKGEKLNLDSVPEAGGIKEQAESKSVQPNHVDLTQNVVKPTEVLEPQDTNLNVISDTRTTLDLTNIEAVTPIPIPQPTDNKDEDIEFLELDD